MIASLINPNINYAPKNKIKGDNGFVSSLYKVELFPDTNVLITLGKTQTSNAKYGIHFNYCYLVKDKDKVVLIGIYEYEIEKEDELFDEDGDLDIQYINGPILFKSESEIKDIMKDVTILEDEGDEDNDTLGDDTELEEPSEIVKEYDDNELFRPQEENEKDNKKMQRKYDATNDALWIRQFMKNGNYGLMDPLGDGNCLFYTIRDAYKSMGKRITVEQLRNKLSDNVTAEQYNNYKEQFDMFNKEINISKKRIVHFKRLMTESKNQANKLKKEFQGKGNRNQALKELKSMLKKIKMKVLKYDKTIKRLKNDVKIAEFNIKDVKWMSSISNIDELRKFIRTCDFWADTWAISTLEIILNTKLIILSSENYESGDYENILQCGFAPESVEKEGKFNPKYYIILDHTGNHYKLITYKDRRIFRFHELPYSVTELVKNKCLMSKTGKNLFSYIPKFKKYIGEAVNIGVVETETIEEAEKIGDDEAEADEEVDETVKSETNDSQGVGDTKIVTEKGDEIEMEIEPSPTPNDDMLYDENVVFQFSSRSRDAKPGEGVGEKIPTNKRSEYDGLRNIAHWRRILSNFYSNTIKGGKMKSLFKLDGLNWASVEHYYQASKYKDSGDDDFYRSFSLDSNTELSKDPRLAKSAGGKTGKYKGKRIRPAGLKVKDDFFDNKYCEKIMERAQEAKYEQDKTSRNALILTGRAKLVHKAPRQKVSIIFYDTMRIRHRINRGK